ncbi:MAG: histidine--tRNA ligase, partial [Candidatus Marinimicrobia bacterium]|nr:histidine--tRNA ligase [Candidatus Neomarinimicrobiota bacterium]
MSPEDAHPKAERISRLKGTHDILPGELPAWRHLEKTVHEVMARFGYHEIRTPIFERTELFSRGVGAQTDMVSKEMYTLEDQGGKSLTLRPELTASIVRAYLQNNLDRESPLSRLYYSGPLFRQERPQKGRQRQFHQFGLEALGSPHPELDVEVVSIAWELCRALAGGDLAVRVNSIGSPESRAGYLDLLRESLAPFKDDLGENDARRLDTNPLRLFDTKNPQTAALLKEHAPKISDHLSAADSDHFAAVLAGLEALEIPFTSDATLVRGLDYYTRTTFEITSTALGAQDALCGGGRYD